MQLEFNFIPRTGSQGSVDQEEEGADGGGDIQEELGPAAKRICLVRSLATAGLELCRRNTRLPGKLSNKLVIVLPTWTLDSQRRPHELEFIHYGHFKKSENHTTLLNIQMHFQSREQREAVEVMEDLTSQVHRALQFMNKTSSTSGTGKAEV